MKSFFGLVCPDYRRISLDSNLTLLLSRLLQLVFSLVKFNTFLMNGFPVHPVNLSGRICEWDGRLTPSFDANKLLFAAARWSGICRISLCNARLTRRGPLRKTRIMPGFAIIHKHSSRSPKKLIKNTRYFNNKKTNINKKWNYWMIILRDRQ